MDFVQKWLPAWHVEGQKVYFGKSGLSWHVSHVTAKISGQYVEHSFIHLLRTVGHVLEELKVMGITLVHVRSDNAGCYHSAGTIGSVDSLSKKNGVKVQSWSFFEAQNGKSSADRIGAQAKMRLRKYLASGKDVKNLDQMFNALNGGRPLAGISVYLSTLKSPASSSSDKMDKIKDYSHFEFSEEGIRVWKYHGIGKGMIVREKLTPLEGSLTIHALGGRLTSAKTSTTDRLSISRKQQAFFWHWRPKYLEEKESDDFDDAVASEDPASNPTEKDQLNYCWCGATFIRNANLQNHLVFGTHRIRPDKITMFDYALGLYKKGLEELQEQHSLLPLQQLINAVYDSSIPTLTMGWALRSRKVVRELPKKAKALVAQYFTEMKSQKKRADPEEAFNKMMARDDIEPEERMTMEQIKGLIGRLSAESKKGEKPKRFRFRRGDPEEISKEEDVVEDEEEILEWEQGECRLTDENGDPELAEDHVIFKFFMNHEELELFFENPKEPIRDTYETDANVDDPEE